MDNFTPNEAKGQGKICLMFLCLPFHFLSPWSTLYFLSIVLSIFLYLSLSLSISLTLSFSLNLTPSLPLSLHLSLFHPLSISLSLSPSCVLSIGPCSKWRLTVLKAAEWAGSAPSPSSPGVPWTLPGPCPDSIATNYPHCFYTETPP